MSEMDMTEQCSMESLRERIIMTRDELIEQYLNHLEEHLQKKSDDELIPDLDERLAGRRRGLGLDDEEECDDEENLELDESIDQWREEAIGEWLTNEHERLDVNHPDFAELKEHLEMCESHVDNE